jgi:hypothetical protein
MVYIAVVENIIPETSKKGNIGLKTLILVGLVVLIGVASFGLGRLSALEERDAGLVIHEPPESQ